MAKQEVDELRAIKQRLEAILQALREARPDDAALDPGLREFKDQRDTAAIQAVRQEKVSEDMGFKDRERVIITPRRERPLPPLSTPSAERVVTVPRRARLGGEPGEEPLERIQSTRHRISQVVGQGARLGVEQEIRTEAAQRVRRAIKSESIPDLASALVFGGAGATVAAATIRKPQTTFRRAAEGIRATGRGFASAAAAVTGMGGQTTGRAAEAVAGTAAALGGTAAAATGGAKVLAGLVGTFAKLKESITAFMQSSLGQIITKIAIAGAAIAGVVLAFKGLVAISNTFKRTLGSIERGAVGAASRQQELADSSLLIAGAFRRTRVSRLLFANSRSI
jgi:hypothetical protein